MARLKKTVTLGEITPDILKRADKAGRRFGARAVDAWPAVVGQDVARHTQSFALRDDHELVVHVDSAAWANQLSLMSDDIRLRLNAHLGENAVRSLRFTVSKRVTEQRVSEALEADIETSYMPEPQNPVALDDVELEQARHVAAAIHDPELRDQALKVMVKDLEQKKGARLKRAEKRSGKPS